MSNDERTLAGLSVLVTRASHQSEPFSQRLQQLGAHVYDIALLSIKQPESLGQIDSAVANIASYDWLIFASANGVDFFFKRMNELKATLPQSIRIATIGPKTAEAVEKHRHRAQYHPTEFIAEKFVSQFPEPVSGKRFLWPKASIGRMLIQEELTKAGAHVDAVVSYITSLPDNPDAVAAQLVDLLSSGKVDAITLASSQTTKHLQQLCALKLEPAQCEALLGSLTAVTIGPETSNAARAIGVTTIRQAREYTIDGMIDALCDLADERAANRQI